jgi:hypothetical protein
LSGATWKCVGAAVATSIVGSAVFASGMCGPLNKSSPSARHAESDASACGQSGGNMKPPVELVAPLNMPHQRLSQIRYILSELSARQSSSLEATWEISWEGACTVRFAQPEEVATAGAISMAIWGGLAYHGDVLLSSVGRRWWRRPESAVNLMVDPLPLSPSPLVCVLDIRRSGRDLRDRKLSMYGEHWDRLLVLVGMPARHTAM